MQQQIKVLSGQAGLEREIYDKQAAVFIHLHYRDTLNKYFAYMEHIPESVPVYISSSDKWVEDEVKKFFAGQKRKITVIHKENRGRDITALLVAFREIMLQYEFVCFVHDKKEKNERDKKDIMLWVDNLWGNLLGKEGTGYFSEVLALFEENKSLGLLVPPEPIGDAFKSNNAWSEANVSQTRKLAEEIDIHADIEPEIERQPIALGTCFWARIDAIRKILVKNWRYEDFDDEPLPESGKSYGVERIFGYLAEDAGYCAYTVMNREYAAIYISFLTECRRKTCPIIENRYAVSNLCGVNYLRESAEYAAKHKIFYIYGAGKLGMGVYRYLTDRGYSPKNFLVTQINQDYSQVPVPVIDIEHFIYEEGTGVIIAVSIQTSPVIVDILEKRGIKDYFWKR